MKKILLLNITLLITTSLVAQISKLTNPKLSPFQKTALQIGLVDVTLEYSRPSMSGREIFGALVPYDKVWRTGANKNTKIIFSDYVVIGGVEVAPGTYTIFTTPTSNAWQVYFHSEIDAYGVPDNFNPEHSVARVSVPALKLNEAVETLAITFDKLTANSASLTIAWERTQVSVPIKIPTDKIITNYLSQEVIALSKEYSLAAYIYYDKEKDSQKALAAINEAIQIVANGMSFEQWLENANLEDDRLAYDYFLKSNILIDLDKKEQAIQAAQKSIVIAKKIKSEYYINTNTENIEKWGKH